MALKGSVPYRDAGWLTDEQKRQAWIQLAPRKDYEWFLVNFYTIPPGGTTYTQKPGITADRAMEGRIELKRKLGQPLNGREMNYLKHKQQETKGS